MQSWRERNPYGAAAWMAHMSMAARTTNSLARQSTIWMWICTSATPYNIVRIFTNLGDLYHVYCRIKHQYTSAQADSPHISQDPTPDAYNDDEWNIPHPEQPIPNLHIPQFGYELQPSVNGFADFIDPRVTDEGALRDDQAALQMARDRFGIRKSRYKFAIRSLDEGDTIAEEFLIPDQLDVWIHRAQHWLATTTGLSPIWDQFRIELAAGHAYMLSKGDYDVGNDKIFRMNDWICELNDEGNVRNRALPAGQPPRDTAAHVCRGIVLALRR